MSAVKAQMKALRAGIVAQLAQVDALIAQVEHETKRTPEGACAHPQRTPAPSMGNPNGWICDVCGEAGGE